MLSRTFAPLASVILNTCYLELSLPQTFWPVPSRCEITSVDHKIRNLEQNIINEDKFNEYKTAKDELENFYDNIATGVKIRSKCDWYQYGEKSTKHFLNLEKQQAANGIVKKIIKNDIEITDHLKIQHKLKMFYEQLFKKTICNSNSKIVSFLDNISIPVIMSFSICVKTISLKMNF